jgi:branched-chain amino acid transport system substrate-binding protein
MTGTAASLGEYLRNGIALGKEEVARRYQGKLEMTVEILDSRNQPTDGLSALHAAMAMKRPDAVISSMSAVSKAIVPIVEQEGILTIVTTTALTDLPKNTRTVVRVYPTSEDFVRPVAEYMARKFDRVSLMFVDDDFGNSNQRLFTEIIKAAGKRVTASEPYKLTQADSRSIVAKLLSTSPQAVFVTGYGPAFSAVFKQIREASPDIPVFTEIGFANPAILATLGTTTEGISFDGTDLELSAPQNPGMMAFRSAYQARFKAEPYQVAGFAHDCIVLLAEAAMKTGTFKKPVKADIISVSPFQGAMGQIAFDNEGECRVPLRLMKRLNGQNVPLVE